MRSRWSRATVRALRPLAESTSAFLGEGAAFAAHGLLDLLADHRSHLTELFADRLHLAGGVFEEIQIVLKQGGKPATATIRRADHQVEKLFDRKVSIFPPNVLDSGDNFFAVRQPISITPGRAYLDICATGQCFKKVLCTPMPPCSLAGRYSLTSMAKQPIPGRRWWGILMAARSWAPCVGCWTMLSMPRRT